MLRAGSLRQYEGQAGQPSNVTAVILDDGREQGRRSRITPIPTILLSLCSRFRVPKSVKYAVASAFPAISTLRLLIVKVAQKIRSSEKRYGAKSVPLQCLLRIVVVIAR